MVLKVPAEGGILVLRGLALRPLLSETSPARPLRRPPGPSHARRGSPGRQGEPRALDATGAIAVTRSASDRVIVMSESGLFSGLSVVIPMKSDEDPQWVADIIATARHEANEIVLVLEARADPLSVRPALGSFGEKTRFVFQTGTTKSDALNRG